MMSHLIVARNMLFSFTISKALMSAMGNPVGILIITEQSPEKHLLPPHKLELEFF